MESLVVLKKEQVDELCGQLPDSEYSDLLCKFLKICGLDMTDIALKARATVEAKSAFDTLISKKTTEEVGSFFGALRLSRIEAFIKDTSNAVEEAINVERIHIREEVKKATDSLRADISKYDLTQEISYVPALRDSSKQLSLKQQALDQLISQAERAYETNSVPFKEVAPEEHWDACAASGDAMFSICLYAATTLFRSSFFGKAGKMGEQTTANLKKIVGNIDSFPFAVRMEETLGLKAMTEMRAFCKLPRPEVKLQPPVKGDPAAGIEAEIDELEKKFVQKEDVGDFVAELEALLQGEADEEVALGSEDVIEAEGTAKADDANALERLEPEPQAPNGGVKIPMTSQNKVAKPRAARKKLKVTQAPLTAQLTAYGFKGASTSVAGSPPTKRPKKACEQL